VIHRIIRETFEQGEAMSRERKAEWKDWLPEAAKHSSERERLAIDAERDTNDLKKAEFMQDKIGETFAGIISSVTSFGMFVELENTVEGLVHVSYMTDDYYHFDETTYTMIGERTGKRYTIGDTVTVKVTGVNLNEQKVDFELVEEEGESLLERKRKRPRPVAKTAKEAKAKAANGRRKKTKPAAKADGNKRKPRKSSARQKRKKNASS
jgi:ribonuclease R